MPLRERIKRIVSRRSSATPSNNSDGSGPNRNSSIFYQPGEKLPFKYRRPVEPAHQAKLDGFSFSNAWRRKSINSQYSPMGSRMPSRQNSITAPTSAPLPDHLSSLPHHAASSRHRSDSAATANGAQNSINRLDTIESVPTHVSQPVNALHHASIIGSSTANKSQSTSTAASST